VRLLPELPLPAEPPLPELPLPAEPPLPELPLPAEPPLPEVLPEPPVSPVEDPVELSLRDFFPPLWTDLPLGVPVPALPVPVSWAIAGVPTKTRPDTARPPPNFMIFRIVSPWHSALLREAGVSCLPMSPTLTTREDDSSFGSAEGS